MNLEEAKRLLVDANIRFEIREYKNENEYWYHTALFPYNKNAKNCKVLALVVKSNNGIKNIELQFNAINDEFLFDTLRFGSFCYEELELPIDIIYIINEITKGNVAIIVSNDLKKKCWISDASFDLSDNDDFFGRKAFQDSIDYINKPKGFLEKLFKSKKQHEIYDWNTYQCIIK